MIQANELRIGNFVYCDNDKDLCEITQIKIGYVQIKYQLDGSIKHSIVENERINPLTLTEGRLIKFGFKKSKMPNNPKLMEFIKNNFIVYIYEEIEVYYDINPAVKIKYVHQLQNLYFALTGKEIML